MNTLTLYFKLLGLFVLLLLVVGFNFAVWGSKRHPASPTLYVRGADAEHGRLLIHSYGCGACHVIPGVRGAVGNVGPRLDRFKYQIYIAGNLPNKPQYAIEWIVSPQEHDPRTAMPDLDVTTSDGAAIVAYLYELP